MRYFLCRKSILSRLDCKPKSAQEISEDIGEPLESVEAQLARLDSENISEVKTDGEVTQWTVRKDIVTFSTIG